MLRAKPPKKKQPEKQPKISTSFIMSVIMPCVMLACKDQFEIETQEELDELNVRVRRYINYISDGTVSLEELHSLMECREPEEELMRRHNAKVIALETRNKQML